jgi:hypothetical protein
MQDTTVAFYAIFASVYSLGYTADVTARDVE